MNRTGQWTGEYIIGVDEAGRGPLAGPVAIGVSLIPKQASRTIFSRLKKLGLNDSKQVKEEGREKLYEALLTLKKEGKIDWEVALISSKIISTKGITFAIRKGINDCLKKLNATNNENVCVLEMDGALKIPEASWKKSSIIIKGDSIKPSIMIASIVAKVTRDRHMQKLAKKFPHYGFEVHKGYGTKKHRDLIREHGLSDEHRAGWCKM